MPILLFVGDADAAADLPFTPPRAMIRAKMPLF